MKRRIFDRILCAVSGLILLLMAGLLTAETFFGVPVTVKVGGILSNDSIRNRLIVIIAVLLLLLFGIALVLLCFRRDHKRKSFVVQRVDGGELSISIKTLDGLVQKCLNRTDDIRVNTTGIENHRDGLVILLRASVPAGVSIPLVTEELQKQIKAYVTACSGVDVKEVRVQVDSMSTAESDSRFAVPTPSQLTAGAALPESAGSPAPVPSACEQPKVQTDKEEKEPAHAENALLAPENAGLQDAQASVAPGSSDEAAAECVNTDGKLHGEDALAADTEPMN